MAKDILLYMSDQHSYRLQGYAGDPIVRTPNLDRLARTGVAMANAMTACPLCVPARAAMISGQLPSNNGVLFNFGSLPSDQATFLHCLNAAGYDTVLCGRMHFVGAGPAARLFPPHRRGPHAGFPQRGPGPQAGRRHAQQGDRL